MLAEHRTGTRALLSVPPEITRVVVKTNGAFIAPPGWREVNGMHMGRNVWLITVERAALPREETK